LCLNGMEPRARNAIAEDFGNPVPLHHDFGRFKGVVEHFMGGSVVKTLATLAGDILKIPDGKSLIACQHRPDAVPLHVFEGGAEHVLDPLGAVQEGNVVAVEDLTGLGLGEDGVYERLALLP
jgi:hypothetical protein